MKKNVLVSLIAISLFISCTPKKQKVTLAEFAEIAKTYSTKIANFESKLDPTNIDSFMATGDSVAAQKAIADSLIKQKFAQVKDTIYLEFTQSKNTERIKILKVWVVDIVFNEVYIEASVEALDNSSFMGPYTSASIIDKDGLRIEVGGGIGAPADKKLVVGEVYKFTGTIDNLHKLGTLKSLNFDEAIKKW